MARKSKSGGEVVAASAQPAACGSNPAGNGKNLDSNTQVSAKRDTTALVRDDASPPAERDARGRFLAGNRVGIRGGPAARAKAQTYLNIMWQEVTDDDWRAIVRRAINDAIHGTRYTVAPARAWLSDYILGKPAERVQLDQNAESPLARVLSVVADALIERAATKSAPDSAHVIDVQPAPQVESVTTRDATKSAPATRAITKSAPAPGGDAAARTKDIDS